MANTYSQIYIHYVFAVQNRLCLIQPKWKNDLYKYMTGIIEKQGHKLFEIGLYILVNPTALIKFFPICYLSLRVFKSFELRKNALRIFA